MGVTVTPITENAGPAVSVSTQVKRIHDRFYLYSREGFWNPDEGKKQYRNYRCLGPCDEKGRLVHRAGPRVEDVYASVPVGALSVFWAAAQELGVLGHVRSALGNAAASRLVLALALNQVTGRRSLDHVPAWIQEGPLPAWLGLGPDTSRHHLDAALSALCHQEEDGTTRDQGLVLQSALTRAWRGQTREPAQYYYDVTKIVYHGSKCALAEPGYFPGGTSRNVVGFGLVTSRDHHHPVLCRAIYGSRHDTVTVEDTVHTLEAFGYRKLTLIMDRGMVSRPNVEFLAQRGWQQVGIVPETHKQAWDYLARLAPEEVERARHVAPRPSGVLYARAWNAKLMGRRMRLAVAVDPYRRVREQSERDLLLHEADTTTDAKRLRDVRHGLGALAVAARGRRGWAVDEALAKEGRKGDGRFLLFSTDLSLSAKDMVTIYFQRESIEHVFRTGKGDLGLAPIRYHRPDRIHAYSTIFYLGWLLWSWTERRLREKYPTLSLHQALESLENVHLVRFASKNGTHEWPTRPNAEQERLLKHLGGSKFLQRTPGS